MYTQNLYVLLRKPLTTEQVAGQLMRMRLRERVEPPESEHWSRLAPGWVLNPPHLTSGQVIVDTVSEPWPMPDDFTTNFAVLSAFRMGFFGLGVHPYSLANACEGLPDTFREQVEEHQGFVRLRIVQSDRGALEEPKRLELAIKNLAYLLRMAYFLLEHEDALSLFVPAASVVIEPRQAWRAYDGAFGEAASLWPLWTKTETLATDSGSGQVTLTGLRQIDFPDICIRSHSLDHASLEAKAQDLLKSLIKLGSKAMNADHIAALGLVDVESDDTHAQIRLFIAP